MIAPVSAFARLAGLLDGLSPAPGLPVIDLHLGEVRSPSGDASFADLDGSSGWGTYPPLGGAPVLRDAYQDWLKRVFGVEVPLADGRLTTEPTPGTKQAVSMLIALASDRRRAGVEGGPVVALPNPFYPSYAQATAHAGATPAWYCGAPAHAVAEIESIAAATQGRLAAIVICHPTSPGGEPWAPEALSRLAGLARRLDALLLVDECYIDLHGGEPVPGVLQALGGDADPSFRAVVALHTLSKRSAAPGLRSGQMAGDPAWVSRYAAFNRGCGVSTPWPVARAAAALWRDERHVAALRDQTRRNWDLAQARLGRRPGFHRPPGGYFLWWPIQDDLARFVREAGARA